MKNAIIDAACISTQNECVKKKNYIIKKKIIKKSIMNFSESRQNRSRENREKLKNRFSPPPLIITGHIPLVTMISGSECANNLWLAQEHLAQGPRGQHQAERARKQLV